MEEKLSGEFKFNNCIHKSSEEETVTIHRCKCQGGNYTDTGYKCIKRDIFKITPAICEYCWAFEDKNG